MSKASIAATTEYLAHAMESDIEDEHLKDLANPAYQHNWVHYAEDRQQDGHKCDTKTHDALKSNTMLLVFFIIVSNLT